MRSSRAGATRRASPRSFAAMFSATLSRLTPPLLATSSEYDRLLVEDTLQELGGGPLDATTDERDAVLHDGSLADEGLAERVAAKVFTRGGLVASLALVGALACAGAMRGYESHDASLVARVAEGMFQSAGNATDAAHRHSRVTARARKSGPRGHSVIKEGHEIPLEQRYAPRAAAMPHDDDGDAQAAMDGVDENAAAAADAVAEARARGFHVREDDDDAARDDEDPDEASNPSASNPIDRTRPDASSSGAPDEDESPYASARRSGRRRGGRAAAALGVVRETATDDDDAAAAAAGDGETMRGGGDGRGASRGTRGASRGARGGRRGDALGGYGYGYGDDSFGGVYGGRASRRGAALPVVPATRMEHGATHKEALEELEASIRDSVLTAHERRNAGGDARGMGRG